MFVLLMRISLMAILVKCFNHGSPLYACDHPRGDSCYFILEGARNQSEAEMTCSQTKGGHLASVKDMSSMEYLKYLLSSTHTNEAWIGAFYSNNGGSDSDVECGVMSVSETGSVQWSTRKCTAESNYACTYERDTHTRPCRYEFHTCGQHCIRRHNRVFGHPRELDWFSAKRICTEFGANLPPIRSIQEAQSWVNTSCHNRAISAGQKPTLQTWTGYTNIKWKWTTDEPVEYTAWHPSFPMPELGKCVKVTKGQMGTFLWKNELCTAKIQAICQIPYPPYGRAEPRSVESEDSREATRSRTTRTTPIPRRKHGRPHFTRRPKTKPSTRQTTTQNRTTISTSSGPDATNEHPEIDLESVGQRHKPRPPTPKPPPPDRPPLPVLYIGLAAGAGFLLLVLVIVIICCWKRKSTDCSTSTKPASGETVPVGRTISRAENPGYDTVTGERALKGGPRGNIYEGLENAAFDARSRHEYEMIADERSGGGNNRAHRPHPPPSPSENTATGRENKTSLPQIDPIRRNMRLPSLPHSGGPRVPRSSSPEYQAYLNRQLESTLPRSIDDQWQYLEVIAPPAESEPRVQESGTSSMNDIGVQPSRVKP